MLMCELEPMEYTATMEDRLFEEYLQNGIDDFDDDEEEEDR